VSDETPATDRHLRVVRGEPTPEELAALTAVVSAAGAAEPEEAEPPRRGRWNDPARAHRQPWRHGPGGWRAGLS
jgi:hypothetical protein